MKVPIKICHDSKLVHQFELSFLTITPGRITTTDNIENTLDAIFYCLNLKDEPLVNTMDDWVVEYFQKGLRNFSVNDVIVFGEVAFICKEFGWETVTLLEGVLK